MLDKIKAFIVRLNQMGIPIPLVRDPKTSTGSVSLTLVFISANVVLIGLLGKMASFFGGVDLTQAIYWFGICCALYFGRNLSTSDKNNNSTKIEP